MDLVATADEAALDLGAAMDAADEAAADLTLVEAGFFVANQGTGAGQLQNDGMYVITIVIGNDGANPNPADVTDDVLFTEIDAEGNAVLRSAADILADIVIAQGIAAVAKQSFNPDLALDEDAIQALLDGLVFVDQLLEAANADLAAQAAVTDAQDALAEAINAVYNAQDLDGYDHDGNPNTINVVYDADFAHLVTQQGQADVIEIANNVVTLTFGGTTGDVNLTTGVSDAANGSAIDLHVTNLAAVEAAETALSDFEDLVSAWEASADLLAQMTVLQGLVTAAGLAVDAALVAIEEDVLIEADGIVNNPALENTLVLGASVVAPINDFGDAGRDFILFDADDDYVGDYTFTILEEGVDPSAVQVGDASVLEVFLQDNGNGGVNVWIETAANAVVALQPNFILTNGTGVTVADLFIDDANSILAAGDYVI